MHFLLILNEPGLTVHVAAVQTARQVLLEVLVPVDLVCVLILERNVCFPTAGGADMIVVPLRRPSVLPCSLELLHALGRLLLGAVGRGRGRLVILALGMLRRKVAGVRTIDGDPEQVRDPHITIWRPFVAASNRLLREAVQSDLLDAFVGERPPVA